jgi:uridine kinase
MRRRQGRYSPEGYFYDARDLDAFVRLLLQPLGPDGDRRFAPQSFDLLKDRAVIPQFETAPADAILIVDGTFLQRPDLQRRFDFVVFLDVPEVVARDRATTRDATIVGTLSEAQRLYDLRYAPAFRLYEAIVDPVQSADHVVEYANG